MIWDIILVIKNCFDNIWVKKPVILVLRVWMLPQGGKWIVIPFSYLGKWFMILIVSQYFSFKIDETKLQSVGAWSHHYDLFFCTDHHIHLRGEFLSQEKRNASNKTLIWVMVQLIFFIMLIKNMGNYDT